MIHEEDCVFSRSVTCVDATVTNKACGSRKCAVWKDLTSWFGYKAPSLSKGIFEYAFRDVAHGGSGIYEKFSVEGASLLKRAANEHGTDAVNSSLYFNGLAKILFSPRERERGLNLLRTLHLHKEACLVNDTTNLYRFGKSYLAAAQSMTSPRAVANYVRVCTAFSVTAQTGAHQHDDPKTWLPTLLLHLGQCPQANFEESDYKLLQDLHMYMGYKHDVLLPRIRECFQNLDNAPAATQVNGDVLLTSFAREYFYALYKAHHPLAGDSVQAQQTLEPRDTVHGTNALANEYAQVETQRFMSSKALEIFACLYMRLHLIWINEPIDLMTYRTPQEAKAILVNLIGACWSISPKEQRSIWMANIFEACRQIQLSLQLQRLSDATVENQAGGGGKTPNGGSRFALWRPNVFQLAKTQTNSRAAAPKESWLSSVFGLLGNGCIKVLDNLASCSPSNRDALMASHLDSSRGGLHWHDTLQQQHHGANYEHFSSSPPNANLPSRHGTRLIPIKQVPVKEPLSSGQGRRTFAGKRLVHAQHQGVSTEVHIYPGSCASSDYDHVHEQD